MIVGSIAGPIYDMGYAHELLLVGSFLIVFGQMMLSLCSTYWQVLLAQGISIGVGTGCIFVSGVAILSTYFSTRLATATGLAASGSSIGGMLYPIIFYKLQPKIVSNFQGESDAGLMYSRGSLGRLGSWASSHSQH